MNIEKEYQVAQQRYDKEHKKFLEVKHRYNKQQAELTEMRSIRNSLNNSGSFMADIDSAFTVFLIRFMQHKNQRTILQVVPGALGFDMLGLYEDTLFKYYLAEAVVNSKVSVLKMSRDKDNRWWIRKLSHPKVKKQLALHVLDHMQDESDLRILMQDFLEAEDIKQDKAMDQVASVVSLCTSISSVN